MPCDFKALNPIIKTFCGLQILNQTILSALRLLGITSNDNKHYLAARPQIKINKAPEKRKRSMTERHNINIKNVAAGHKN